MSSGGELYRRAELQRARRMARRMCGNCGGGADEMIKWARQSIPVCRACLRRLEAPPSRDEPYCAFEEVLPHQLRPVAAVPVAPQRDSPETPEEAPGVVQKSALGQIRKWVAGR